MTLSPGGRRAAGAALLALAAALALSGSAAAQCAMCKTALTGSPEGQSLSGELNQAILVMMAGPYLVMGAFGVVLFRARIRSAAARLRGRLRALRTPRGSR